MSRRPLSALLAVLVLVGASALGACLEDEASPDARPDAGASDGGVDGGGLHPDALGADADPEVDGGPGADAEGLDAPGADADPSARCELTVEPARLVFGVVERGRRAVLPVTLDNGGGADCALEAVTLTGAQLSLLGPAPTTVAAGSRAVLDVAFDSAGDGSGELTVTRAGAAPLTMGITASSTTSPVRLLPGAAEAAHAVVGCRTTRTVTVEAEGPTVTLTGARLDDGSDPALTVRLPTFPITVERSRGYAIPITYQPTAPGVHAARLLVTAEGETEPRSLGIWASAEADVAGLTVTESFPPGPDRLDVLFVVDDSPSMVEEQGALVAAARAVIARLQAAGVDFRLAATTTDPRRNGQLVEVLGARWIEARAADPLASFTSLIDTIGTAGTGSEAGLEAAYAALSGDALAGSNAGFLRSDARLAVIVLSDEEDSSPREATFYADFLASLKPRQPELAATLSAIVLFPTDTRGCAGSSATAGRRYLDVARDSGGSIASICSQDWDRTLGPIGSILGGARVFFSLRGQPEPQSVEVRVDGAAVATGWSYDSTARTLRFEAPSSPAAGSTVEIRYAPLCL